ncbi:hypothetical protein ABPG72_010134 [Tetrahymena utriculariae]
MILQLNKIKIIGFCKFNKFLNKLLQINNLFQYFSKIVNNQINIIKVINYVYLMKITSKLHTDHDDNEEFDFQEQKVTRSGQIGLFVREYGRGTIFFSLDLLVNKAGGVVIIQIFISDHKKEEINLNSRKNWQVRKNCQVRLARVILFNFKLIRLNLRFKSQLKLNKYVVKRLEINNSQQTS